MTDRILWAFYSRVYDVLNDLSVYQMLLQEICSALNIKLDGKYLDIGCGTGNLSSKIGASGGHVIGLDFSEGMLDRARVKNPNITFVNADLNKTLQFSDNGFDGIVGNNVLAYLANIDFTLREIFRVLKPGGKFVISTPKKGFSPIRVFREHINKAGVFSYLRIIPSILIVGLCNAIIVFRVKRNIYHAFMPDEFRLLLEKAGFKNIHVSFAYANQNLLATCEKSL